MKITDAEIKKTALDESIKLLEVSFSEKDPGARKHRAKLLLHLSIYNLAQGIVAQMDNETHNSHILVESIEIKDLIIEACHELQKMIQTGELKFSKEGANGTNKLQ